MGDCTFLVERELESILHVLSLHEGQEVVAFAPLLFFKEVDVAVHGQGRELLADGQAIFTQPAKGLGLPLHIKCQILFLIGCLRSEAQKNAKIL